jgi:tetratricopeptide (TPR) repeat protein
MKTMDFSYFIERYNAGEMSDSEKQWFQKELDENVNLRNEVKLRKRTDEVLEKQNIISLRTKLSVIEEGRKSNSRIRITSKPVYLKFAAVIAGLILIGGISLFSGKNLNSDEIINRYYKAYDFPATQRSGLSASNTDFASALVYYNSQEYAKAAILFNKVLEVNPKDMQSEFLVGISNIGDKKFPEAKKSFGRVIDNDNSYFVDAAKWYLAFCYLNTDEKDKAIKQFEIIGKDGSIYSKRAKKIIRSIK